MSRPVLLSIDDSKAVHSFLNHCLSDVKVDLVHAFDGKEGLETIKSADRAFDLILLDWEMPVLNGPDTLDQIKKLSPVPVIMLTSKSEVEEISQMLEKGAFDYVLKPFTKDIILEKIENATNVKLEKK